VDPALVGESGDPGHARLAPRLPDRLRHVLAAFRELALQAKALRTRTPCGPWAGARTAREEGPDPKDGPERGEGGERGLGAIRRPRQATGGAPRQEGARPCPGEGGAARMKKGAGLRKGAAAGLLYKGPRFVARKVWPLVEKRLASKNRKRF